MKRLLTVCMLIGSCYAQAQTLQPGKIEPTGQILLPNGWKLSPAGRSMPLGELSDLPLNLQISRSGRLMAVTNNGQSTQSIQLLDPLGERLLDEKEIKRSWYGLAFSPDEKHLYVSGGYDNWILDFRIQGDHLGNADTIRLGKPWPKEKTCPSGMVVD